WPPRWSRCSPVGSSSSSPAPITGSPRPGPSSGTASSTGSPTSWRGPAPAPDPTAVASTGAAARGVPVPATIAELTPAWLTAALAEGGGPGSRVATVDTEPIGLDTGFLGHLARLHLAYDGGDGPATLVAKLPTTDPGG